MELWIEGRPWSFGREQRTEEIVVDLYWAFRGWYLLLYLKFSVLVHGEWGVGATGLFINLYPPP